MTTTIKTGFKIVYEVKLSFGTILHEGPFTYGSYNHAMRVAETTVIGNPDASVKYIIAVPIETETYVLTDYTVTYE